MEEENIIEKLKDKSEFLKTSMQKFKELKHVLLAYQECIDMIINVMLFAQVILSQLRNIKHVWLV